MEWETPQVEEICLSCEINSYSNGELSEIADRTAVTFVVASEVIATRL